MNNPSNTPESEDARTDEVESHEEDLREDGASASGVGSLDDDEEDLDEDLDLREFEGEGGLEGTIARMRAAERDPLSLGWDEDDEEELGGRRRGRHPYLAAFVSLASVALCLWIWPDVRFWLESSPREIGEARALFERPDADASLQNRLVTVRGTPDVSYAARLRIGDASYRFVRILEGGDRLFALLPDGEGTRSDEFEGSFTGRAKRLSDVRFFDEVVTYFDNQGVTRTQEVSVESLEEGLRSGRLEASGASGASDVAHVVALDDVARVNVVVDRGEFKLVLGRSTWPDDASAQAAIAALGFPWAQLKSAGANQSDDMNASIKRSYGRRFVVAVPEEARAGMVAKLNADAGVSSESADPKVGALGLPQRYTYAVRPSAVTVVDGRLEVDMDGVTTSPGFELRDGALVERALNSEGRLVVEASEVARLEVDERLSVDPDGTIILVGRTPEDERTSALMFAVVGMLGLFNVIAVAIFVRRRRGVAPA